MTEGTALTPETDGMDLPPYISGFLIGQIVFEPLWVRLLFLTRL
jgi:hypothetical protein